MTIDKLIKKLTYLQDLGFGHLEVHAEDEECIIDIDRLIEVNNSKTKKMKYAMLSPERYKG